MLVKTQAIVISALKYQEKGLIVRCLTKEVGLQTFYVPNAFSKGKSSSKIAYFQPLMNLEVEFVFKNKGKMEYFKEIKIGHLYQDIYYDFYKNSIAIFIAEVLHLTITLQERDLEFFAYLQAALMWLDTHDHPANFHLILLLDLSKYFGFYPDLSQIDNDFFNWKEGGFTSMYSLECFDAEQTHLFKKLVDLNFNKEQKVFTSKDRKILLNLLVIYYQEHLSNFKKPKSLQVLQEVFG
ncbi:DNA repair protein RecO [Myroides sp. LJL119]